MTTDVLVIGGGIAGLSLVAKAAKWLPDISITMITKDNGLESNTRYAQGGIAIVLDSSADSFDRHVEDTVVAGAGLCDRTVVEKVVKEGPDRLRELIEWGVQFDRDATGNLALGREGGHTAHRIIHYKDSTGFQIADALLKHVGTLPNVAILDHHFALDLVTEIQEGNSTCVGAQVLDVRNRLSKIIAARATVLCTGGIGQVYSNTTNPPVATGDGVSMAYRAGARIRDMEFVQFHPTAFHSNGDTPSFLISEALRGFGAHLVTGNEERFLLRYDPRGELASRDIVSQAIHHEMKENGAACVFVDCRHLDGDDLKDKFPFIYNACFTHGYDITRELVPVSPAAHYSCGGIEVDIRGRTSIANLYACGECSCTGLHGANRLASNSLLEALVYAHEIFLELESNVKTVPVPKCLNASPTSAAGRRESHLHELRWKLRHAMTMDAGIVRTNSGLARLREMIAELSLEAERDREINNVRWWELRNMLQVAALIVEHSLTRRENCGTFHNTDLVAHA